MSDAPLFDGSPHSVLQTLVNCFQWFCEHPGISKEALSSMLAMQKSLLPAPNNLPGSYETALHVIEPHIVTPVSYDICVNDCILFRKQFSGLTKCPDCGADRKSGQVRRHFLYLPLKPRLQRLFGSSCMAEILQSHLTHPRGTTMQDIHDSPAWQDAYCREDFYALSVHNINCNTQASLEEITEVYL
jgi:hypothetical protein